MKILEKKRILITGLSNKMSIAYGIAKVMKRYGAEIAFSYQSERMKRKISALADLIGTDIIMQCDVTCDRSINDMFSTLSRYWSSFDGFVHSIAFAENEQLNGDIVDNSTRDGFKISHDISVYSLIAIAKACKKMLNPNSAILTITYIGSKRVVPNYNIMGLAKASLEACVRYVAFSLGKEKFIRVNAISSGPIKTVASTRIKNFKKILSLYKRKALIKRNVHAEDIGNVATFLFSNLSYGITGEIIHVDYGFNTSI